MFTSLADTFFTTGRTSSLELLKSENEFLNDRIRIELQEKSYYYYIGDIVELTEYLETAIRKVLGDEVVNDKEWLYDFVNITEKLINRRAIIYQEPAVRYFVREDGEEDEELTEYYNSIIPIDINTKNKKAHRFAKLFNTSLTQVTFDKKTGKINYQIQPSCNYLVETDEYDSLIPERIGYQKEFINEKGQEEVYTVVWTADEHYKLDANNKKSPVGENEDMVNPFGVLPFAILRMSEGDDFWGIGAEDIVNVNEIINFLLTYLVNDGIVSGSSGIPLFINTDIEKKTERKNDQKKARVGRRHPIVIDDVHTDMVQPSVSYVSTNPLITEIQNSIDYRIKQIAVSKGLNPNTILSEIKDTSDYQKMMDAAEQLEVRRDDIEPCRSYEWELFNITRIVNNKAYEDAELRTKYKLQEIPEEAEIYIDFAEIKQEKTNAELWQDRAEREKRNMGSPIDWLIEENPDLTEDDAKEILEKNKAINIGAGSQKQPTLFEQLNLNEEEEEPENEQES